MDVLWSLRGSGVLLLRDMRHALALVHYDSSPVGAYDEFAVVELSMRGPHVSEMPVNSTASCEAGRALWGFPKTLETLGWKRAGKRIIFRREDETFFFRVVNWTFPLRARAWTRQTLNGRSVRVPFAICGRARIAFRGRQWVLVLEDFELQVFAPEAGAELFD